VRVAPADGETLLYATSIYAVAPHLLDLPFDPFEDFVALGGIAHLPTLLVAGPRAAPYADAPAVLTALARGWPVSFASGGAGTPSHMAAMLFAGAAGARPELVQYRGGGPALDGLLLHQAEMMFDNPHPGLFEGVATGALRVLMAMQPDPVPELAEVPTLDALGGAVAKTVRCWHGVLAPRGTPAEMLSLLAEALGAAAAAADVQAALRAIAIEPAPAGPAAFAAFFRAEAERWRRFLEDAPIAG
jgi:tripartite-type tricarboxylate transporter receptor subunit TctC